MAKRLHNSGDAWMYLTFVGLMLVAILCIAITLIIVGA